MLEIFVMFLWENITNITIANLFSEINNKYYKKINIKQRITIKSFVEICIIIYHLCLSKRRPSHHKILF